MNFPEEEATGYYLPIQFIGKKGQVIKRASNSKSSIFGETDDTDDTMNLILSVNQSAPVISFTEYSSRTNSILNTEGIPFTVDCSKCNFN